MRSANWSFLLSLLDHMNSWHEGVDVVILDIDLYFLLLQFQFDISSYCNFNFSEIPCSGLQQCSPSHLPICISSRWISRVAGGSAVLNFDVFTCADGCGKEERKQRKLFNAYGTQLVLEHEGRKTTTKQVVKGLIADDGWKGLYRGLGPRLFSMSAWGTSMILAYEYLSRTLFFSLDFMPEYHSLLLFFL
ncbi:hypothetical protein CK203_029049 [Vitis vinifera]|uniref:Uncharacterized protein n=1 Tax=Vitis vinifera TaxID=29760 RepID=A0A438IMM1_VITVI|nr:hypothetical protein CK203_029049 [Vitis vinifera]